jgi:hypothetical protein
MASDHQSSTLITYHHHSRLITTHHHSSPLISPQGVIQKATEGMALREAQRKVLAAQQAQGAPPPPLIATDCH